ISVPPGTGFTLRRELEREVAGGKAIRVRRAWVCRIEAFGRGLGVTGNQISASVDAPPSLAAFAAIEEGRNETGFLPAALDAKGLILARGEPTHSPEVASAVALASALFEALPPGDPRIPAARQFLAEISNRAALLLSRVPSDLFFPEPRSEREVRPFDADGEPARIVIETEAETHQDTGLLASLERRITTEIGTDSRLSRDVWTLEPDPVTP
ncbi:MAG: hypothetical protein MK010_06545, partial [Erythrobacter sp.]|nr:hypothetical protein [Erythrobacter sp.]